ncbi:MAG TPA: ribosome biogenesis GTP-binding protein YihA/YsxC [Gemmatimonadaceae bacterium]|nr:ribosome biogenesis GTP-binding protein YihA/YsxC [Gemmatimonadaceae bacterium]
MSDDTRGAPRGGDGAHEGPEPRATDPLVIRDLAFLGGMASVGGWRPDNTLPEIAFAGRSNVGKSSLLNRLVRRKAFARVSRTPGRTREINFFRVNHEFVLVDLPGYGYARIAKERRREWKPLMERYLAHTRQLRGIVQLLDARREPSPEDLEMLDFLAELGVPVLFAVTKVDKLRPAEVGPRVAELAGQLGVDEAQLIPFSAVTGRGRDELAEALVALVREPAWSRA